MQLQCPLLRPLQWHAPSDPAVNVVLDSFAFSRQSRSLWPRHFFNGKRWRLLPQGVLAWSSQSGKFLKGCPAPVIISIGPMATWWMFDGRSKSSAARIN